MLAGPGDYPETVRFIEEIAMKVHGRNGATMIGAALANPLAVPEIARLYGYELSPLEIDGVLMVDAALIAPIETDDDEPSSDTGEARQSRAERIKDAQDRARKLRKE